MKKIFLLLLFMSTVGFIIAQEENDSNIETIFKKPSKVRGYIGSLNNVTTLNGETAYMNGVNVAGIFNDQFIFGFYKLNLENSIFSNTDNYIGTKMNFDHKGLWIGYIFMPNRKVHFNANVQAGKGFLEIYDSILDSWLEDDFVFVVMPSIEAEFNITKFLRIGMGANYRFAMDVNEFNNYNNNDFSDFGGFVSFKFGWFK